MSIAAWNVDQVERFGDQIALFAGERCLTNARLHSCACRLEEQGRELGRMIHHCETAVLIARRRLSDFPATGTQLGDSIEVDARVSVFEG